VLRRSPFSLAQRYKWSGTAIILLLLLILATLLFSYPRWQYLKNNPFQEEGESLILDQKARRIEELKKSIYEKLKEREDRQPAAPAPGVSVDRWTSKPVVIAIFDIFDEESEALPDWTIRIIGDLQKRLTGRFVEDIRTRVAERKDLDKLLAEKDLELSDFSFTEQKDLFGRFLFANVMIFLEGYKTSDGISLNYKVVDADTGEIDRIDSSFTLSKKADPDLLAESIYSGAREIIYQKHPLQGRIADVRENLVVLNIGAHMGIRKGDVFDVFGSENASLKGIRIGKLMALNDVIDPEKAINDSTRYTNVSYFRMTIVAPFSEYLTSSVELIEEAFQEIGIDVEVKWWKEEIILPRLFLDPIQPGFSYEYGGFDVFIGDFSLNIDLDFGNKYFNESFAPMGENFQWIERQDLKEIINCNIKVLHVIRNPFDNISTMVLRHAVDSNRPTREEILDKIELYFRKVGINQGLRISGEIDVVDIYQESFIENPEETLLKILTFLDLEAPEDYVKVCSQLVYREPHRSRNEIPWPDDLKDLVEIKIKDFDFLKHYNFID